MGSTLSTDPHMPGYLKLAYKILERAIKDAKSKDPIQTWAARGWLVFDPLASELLSAFDVDQEQMAGWVRDVVKSEREKGHG